MSRDIFKDYIKEGFKPVRCKGNHPKYNSTNDYKTAKEPVDKGFTDKSFKGINLKEILQWMKQGGWIGWVIPEGYIALDAEGDYKISLIESICKKKRIHPSIHITNYGKFYLFKLKKDLPASSSINTKSGLELTYRIGGKNYIILAPVNGRTWEKRKKLKTLPPLPDEFKPYDINNKEDVLRAISCKLGEALSKKQINGYDDVDASFLTLLVESDVPFETVRDAFKMVFRNRYDESRTALMYGRTQERIKKGESVRGFESFIKKIRELNLDSIETLLKHLNTRFTGRLYLKGKKFIPKRLADELMKEFSCIYTAEQLYVYQNGVYQPCGDDFIRKQCRNRLGEESRTNRVTEVIEHITDLCKIDTDELNIKAKELINVKNGMLNWKTGKLLPHDKQYLSTIQTPVAYKPEAKCPHIDRFFNKTLPQDCIPLVEEIAGYCLIPDVRFERAFMFVGSGANGKSTLLNLIGAFLGKSNISKIPLQELCDHRFKRAGLFGRVANIFTDLSSKSLQDPSYFKAIVSGDDIDAERKFKTPFSFKPFSRLIFSANKIPRSYDRTFAFYRRWSIVPFPFTFKGRKANRNLISKLTTKDEMSGLLNRAVTGLKRVFKNRDFTENETTREALQDYKIENDSILAFITDKCRQDKKYCVERTTLYHSFTLFCAAEGRNTVGRKLFYSGIRELQGVRDKTINGRRFFVGIGMKYIGTEEEDDVDFP
jgi:putative DNA primase/helicase